MSLQPGTPSSKFLIVDDDSDDSSLFREALKEVGPSTLCYTAEDGQDALQKMDNAEIDRPDIIFLDINMPVMGGWECLNKLKSIDKFKDIPVIIHTTSSRRVDRQLAKELGALCFVTKLYDYKKLKSMLSIVIEKLKTNAANSICESIYQQLGLN